MNAVSNDQIVGNGPFDFFRNIAGKAYSAAKTLAPVLGPVIKAALPQYSSQVDTGRRLLGVGLNQGHQSVSRLVNESRDVRASLDRSRGKNSALVGRLINA